MRVAILPTGGLEWEALPDALQTLFPEHDFYSVPTREEVNAYGEDYPAPSFTSGDASKLLEKKPRK